VLSFIHILPLYHPQGAHLLQTNLWNPHQHICPERISVEFLELRDSDIWRFTLPQGCECVRIPEIGPGADELPEDDRVGGYG